MKNYKNIYTNLNKKIYLSLNSINNYKNKNKKHFNLIYVLRNY